MLQIDAIPQGDFLSPCWRDACSFLRTTRRNAAWSGENPALFRGERNGAG